MSNTSKKVEISRTNDEIQLLSDATIRLNVEENYEGVNWRSKRNKYDRIMKVILEQYPRY